MGSRNGTTPAVITAPDVLGAQGRANAVAGMLRDIQERRFSLDIMQAANGHSDADAVAGAGTAGSLYPDGTSYAQAKEKLDKAERMTAEAFPDEMALLAEG